MPFDLSTDAGHPLGGGGWPSNRPAGAYVVNIDDATGTLTGRIVMSKVVPAAGESHGVAFSVKPRILTWIPAGTAYRGTQWDRSQMLWHAA